MQVRRIEEKDLVEISSWFSDVPWDLPAVEGAFTKDGFVCERESIPLSCAWLYVTGSSVGFIFWTNTNPNADLKDQADSLSFLIEEMKKISSLAQPPIRSIVMFTKNENFKDKLKHLGFRSSSNFYQCTWVGKKNEDKSL